MKIKMHYLHLCAIFIYVRLRYMRGLANWLFARQALAARIEVRRWPDLFD